MNKIERYFETLKTKDLICWGNGKHYRNITYLFLQKSGLIENLKGFADASDKEKLAQMDRDKTVILIAVTGYDEILGQLKADERLSGFEAVPSIYLEALYEDMLLLSVKKPPLNYRKEDKPVIPKLIHAIWFSGDPMPELYLRCLESWKKYAPDCEIKIWNMETYKPDRCLFFEQAIEHKN